MQRIQVGDYDRAGGHSVTIDLCLLDAIPADNGGGRVPEEQERHTHTHKIEQSKEKGVQLSVFSPFIFQSFSRVYRQSSGLFTS